MEVQRDVDTGQERLIKGLDTICREEQDSTVVFNVTKAIMEGQTWE